MEYTCTLPQKYRDTRLGSGFELCQDSQQDVAPARGHRTSQLLPHRVRQSELTGSSGLISTVYPLN